LVAGVLLGRGFAVPPEQRLHGRPEQCLGDGDDGSVHEARCRVSAPAGGQPCGPPSYKTKQRSLRESRPTKAFSISARTEVATERPCGQARSQPVGDGDTDQRERCGTAEPGCQGEVRSTGLQPGALELADDVLDGAMIRRR
jgi:hypothetical protein